uniref:hypothetical protein n=1 Tax=Methylosinus sp. Ce-a6 TaxID=2172005 RepID=UPI001AED3E12
NSLGSSFSTKRFKPRCLMVRMFIQEKVYGQTVRFASWFSGAFDRHSARHFRIEKAEASAVVEFAVELFSRTSASGASAKFEPTRYSPSDSHIARPCRRRGRACPGHPRQAAEKQEESLHHRRVHRRPPPELGGHAKLPRRLGAPAWMAGTSPAMTSRGEEDVRIRWPPPGAGRKTCVKSMPRGVSSFEKT